MTPAAALRRISYLQFTSAPPRALPGLVVIAGKEHLLADEVLRRIVETVLPDESLRPLNVDALDAATTDDYSSLAEKLSALPFLAERRVVIIRSTNELRNDDRIALRDAIPVIPEQSLLIIDDSGEPKPQRGKAPKDKVYAEGFAGAHPDALLIDTTLDERDREQYIETYAQAIGISVDAGARRYLAAFDSVYEIRNALDRLALVAKKITKAAAEEYVKPPGDPKLWDLGNAVGRGDLNAALRLAREIVTKPEDAPGPLIWLAGDAQIAWELANGATPNTWAAASGQSPFRAMKLWDVARKHTAQQARDNVKLTMKALEDSLTGKRVPDQALEEVIIRLCASKQQM
jgi:DNA polymerase III delta subunit